MTQVKINGDNVRAYLRDIGRIPLLEHEEEILLGRKVQRLMKIIAKREELKEELGKSYSEAALARELGISDKQLKRQIKEGERAKNNKITCESGSARHRVP